MKLVYDYDAIAERINEEIYLQRTNIKRISEVSGVEVSTVRKFLNRKNMVLNINTLMLVCNNLGFMSVEELISKEKNELMLRYKKALDALPIERQIEELQMLEIKAENALKT
jgi:hypothetical protein